MTIEERNNYICTYMGGEEYILNKHFSKKKSKRLTLNDLKFHESWDWMIPVWKKIRFDLSPTMVIFAINCIDDDNINELHTLLSNICYQKYTNK